METKKVKIEFEVEECFIPEFYAVLNGELKAAEEFKTAVEERGECDKFPSLYRRSIRAIENIKEIRKVVAELFLINQLGSGFGHSLKTDKKMKSLHKNPKVSRQAAIKIAMNHNCVSGDVAEKYTDSELKEVLKQLNLKANF